MFQNDKKMQHCYTEQVKLRSAKIALYLFKNFYFTKSTKWNANVNNLK